MATNHTLMSLHLLERLHPKAGGGAPTPARHVSLRAVRQVEEQQLVALATIHNLSLHLENRVALVREGVAASVMQVGAKTQSPHPLVKPQTPLPPGGEPGGAGGGVRASRRLGH